MHLFCGQLDARITHFDGAADLMECDVTSFWSGGIKPEAKPWTLQDICRLDKLHPVAASGRLEAWLCVPSEAYDPLYGRRISLPVVVREMCENGRYCFIATQKATWCR